MTESIFDSAPPRRKPFVILCFPRTGSYLLVDLLRQFPQISCHGEIFKNKCVELPPPVKKRVGYSLEQRNEDPLGYIRKVVSLEPDKHTGFKIFPSHCAIAWDWCRQSPEINRIALWRSPFEVYVSLERAKATGVWIDRDGGPQQEKQRLVFDAEVFDRQMNLYSKHNDKLRKLAESDPGSTRLVNYNQLTDPDFVRDIAAFLGVTVQPEALEYRLHKQTTERYSELFANFGELADHVASHHPTVRIDPAKV